MSSGEDEFEQYNQLYGPKSQNARFMNFVENIATHGFAVLQAEEEAESSQRTRKKRTHIVRDREAAGELLMNHYFDPDHIYTDVMFSRRYRMTRNMFVRIVENIRGYNEQPLPFHFKLFQSGMDCTGRKPFTIHQRMTVAIRQLAYGVAGDVVDEYLQMGETTALQALDNFCKCIIDLYRSTYLRKSNDEDIQQLYQQHKQVHGFPRMLGSIDCMHWAWKNCLTAWRGQFKRGDHGHPKNMLKAVASQDLWIWHAYFGVPGSNNDINVLNQSTLFDALLMDNALMCPFTVNENQYRHGYYLADEMYPE